MKRANYILLVFAAAGILGIACQSALAQTIVFSDTFANGSTVQTTPSTPTANSTTYEWFQQGGTPTAPTIGAGDLHLQGRTTSSSIAEVQALFTTTPVTLTTVGQSLNLTVVFVNNQNIFPTGSASTLNVGLYNSHNSAPVTGVRLDSFGSGTGGAIGWTGYVGRMGGTGGATSAIFTRPPQIGDGSTNKFQDILFNGVSSGSTYNNPAGTTVANSGGQFAPGLTGGSTYTLSYTITLSGTGTLTIDNNLYSGGVVDPLNLLFSQTGTTSSSPETSYDAFGFGWRYNSASAANSVDVNSITLTTATAVPEPSTFALAGLGLAGLALRFRRMRR